MKNYLLIIGAIGCALAVMLGAFGAHSLREVLVEKDFTTLQTATQYLFFHSLGLLIIGVISLKIHHRLILLAGNLMVTGVILFSGSLYSILILEIKWIGVITPFGGTLLITSWVLLAIGILKA